MHKLTLASAATVLVVGAAALVGCAPAQTTNSSSRLTIALSSAMDSWNPAEAVSAQSYSVFPQVLTGLLAVSADGTRLEPGIAESYDADIAARTITFHLDPKATFSTGAAVTAKDVVFSEGLWAASALYGSYFSAIQAVTAVDDQTVLFQLDAPDPTLLGILASSNAAVVPADFGGQSPEDFWAKPIGAGAYAIDSENKGQTIDLVRNEHYDGAPSRPETVEYKIVSDESQRLLQFQNGDVDIVNGVTLGSASQYDAAVLASIPMSGVSALIPQTRVAPLDNVDFRRALSLAIDRKALIGGGYSGRATQPTSLLPQGIPGVTPCDQCDWSDNDIAKAKSLVASSGYDGRMLTLVAASDTGPEALAAQALVPMLADAGINVQVQTVPMSTLIDRLGSGNFDLAALTYAAGSPSPLDPLGFLSTTGVLFSGSDPAAAVAALGALRSAADDAAVSVATSDFERWVYSNTPVVPLVVPDMVYAVSSRVGGFVPSPTMAYRVASLTLSD